MKRLAGLSTLALIISGTSGCGWIWGEDGYFRDRGSDYLQARQVPPMQAPADVRLRPIEPLLPIPQQVADTRASGEYEVPRPQRLVVAEESSDFSLQTSEDARWLVAMRAPSQVWTATRQFFTDNGFQSSSPPGRRATNWLRHWCATLGWEQAKPVFVFASNPGCSVIPAKSTY